VTKGDELERADELAAIDRYKAYQRRWRVARFVPPATSAAWFWAEAYVRRTKVIERRWRHYERPKITPVGNLHDLLRQVH
jgi:hypothetical protein